MGCPGEMGSRRQTLSPAQPGSAQLPVSAATWKTRQDAEPVGWTRCHGAWLCCSTKRCIPVRPQQQLCQASSLPSQSCAHTGKAWPRAHRDGLVLPAQPQPWLTHAEGVSASPHRDFTPKEPQETETQAGSRRPRQAPLCATSPVLGSVAVRA